MSKLETDSIHSGLVPEENLQALSLPPISTGVSYKLPAFGSKLFEALLLDNNRTAHVYSRWSNPTVRVLEERMAALEGAPAAVAVASGMAAISALAFTFLSSGDHLIANEVCYAGAVELFALHLPRFGIEVSQCSAFAYFSRPVPSFCPNCLRLSGVLTQFGFTRADTNVLLAVKADRLLSCRTYLKKNNAAGGVLDNAGLEARVWP